MDLRMRTRPPDRQCILIGSLSGARSHPVLVAFINRPGVTCITRLTVGGPKNCRGNGARAVRRRRNGADNEVLQDRCRPYQVSQDARTVYIDGKLVTDVTD